MAYLATDTACPPECIDGCSDPARGAEFRLGAGWAVFRVRGDASPQLLMRILGLLAQQDKMPDRATIEKVDETLEVTLALGGLVRHRAEVVAEKVRAMVGSHSVDLAWHASPLAGPSPMRPMCRSVSDLHGDRAGTA